MRIRLLFGSIFLLSTGCFGTTATYYLSSLKTSLGQAIVDMHGLKTINFYVNQQESYTSDDSITFTTTTVFNNNVKLHVLHKDQVISNSISFDANGHLIVSDTNHLLSSKIGSYYNILVYASNDDGSIRSSPEKDRSYFDLHITPKPASVSIDSEISVDRNLSKSSPIDFNINVAHASPVVFDENNQELMFNEWEKEYSITDNGAPSPYLSCLFFDNDNSCYIRLRSTIQYVVGTFVYNVVLQIKSGPEANDIIYSQTATLTLFFDN